MKPPELVLIDLAALYGRPPHFRRPNVTILAELSIQVVGMLDAWVLSSVGWLGAVRYQVKLQYGDFLHQEHLVPARMLRKASWTDVRQGQLRGEIADDAEAYRTMRQQTS
ncbi:hypothetical protein [Nakamurella multipartita]|uniref:Uncharacterized protein n=1 Tax=Nakamurella multipartita (strain ATCC 700099 / DSM 44233 / CIP 104796 / JCM 9543 / NBRC 105858 / Y-104) TaxID=479431 RepID=C8X8M3_NAKMY|nr:hypothetical protein [Nakamurella multipartita]ACV79078.1 hypothetical protein Namu_2732 [Nakamurella multipartita DSM 44233]